LISDGSRRSADVAIGRAVKRASRRPRRRMALGNMFGAGEDGVEPAH
jgi:hypothetical protein